MTATERYYRWLRCTRWLKPLVFGWKCDQSHESQWAVFSCSIVIMLWKLLLTFQSVVETIMPDQKKIVVSWIKTMSYGAVHLHTGACFRHEEIRERRSRKWKPGRLHANPLAPSPLKQNHSGAKSAEEIKLSSFVFNSSFPWQFDRMIPKTSYWETGIT